MNEYVQEREMNPEIVANAEKALRQLDENIDGPRGAECLPGRIVRVAPCPVLTRSTPDVEGAETDDE